MNNFFKWFVCFLVEITGGLEKLLSEMEAVE
jgi:hypothetical protein